MPFRLLLYCCIFLLFLIVGHKGYNFRQSDWSGTPKLDYATNKVASNYFGADAKEYRVSRFKQFMQVNTNPPYHIPKEVVDRLVSGDTITIGVDYYALLGVSAPLFPIEIKETVNKTDIAQYYKLFIENRLLRWESI